ncbi:MAG: TetR/AcrR family transcriptional regulator [Bacilli bacterium]
MDPRIIRTRIKIKASFLSLIAEKEFEKIAVKDIAESAGVNRITFYDHFKDKYDLLNEIYKDLDQEAYSVSLSVYQEETDVLNQTYIKISNYLLGFVKALSKRKELLYSLVKQTGGYVYFSLENFLTGKFLKLITSFGDSSLLIYSLDQTVALIVGGIISFVVSGLKEGKYDDNNYENLFYDAQRITRAILNSKIIFK